MVTYDNRSLTAVRDELARRLIAHTGPLTSAGYVRPPHENLYDRDRNNLKLYDDGQDPVNKDAESLGPHYSEWITFSPGAERTDPLHMLGDMNEAAMSAGSATAAEAWYCTDGLNAIVRNNKGTEEKNVESIVQVFKTMDKLLD